MQLKKSPTESSLSSPRAGTKMGIKSSWSYSFNGQNTLKKMDGQITTESKNFKIKPRSYGTIFSIFLTNNTGN